MSPREGLNVTISRWHALSMVFPKDLLASVTLSPFVFGLAHLCNLALSKGSQLKRNVQKWTGRPYEHAMQSE